MLSFLSYEFTVESSEDNSVMSVANKPVEIKSVEQNSDSVRTESIVQTNSNNFGNRTNVSNMLENVSGNSQINNEIE